MTVERGAVSPQDAAAPTRPAPALPAATRLTHAGWWALATLLAVFLPIAWARHDFAQACIGGGSVLAYLIAVHIDLRRAERAARAEITS